MCPKQGTLASIDGSLNMILRQTTELRQACVACSVAARSEHCAQRVLTVAHSIQHTQGEEESQARQIGMTMVPGEHVVHCELSCTL